MLRKIFGLIVDQHILKIDERNQRNGENSEEYLQRMKDSGFSGGFIYTTEYD